jgi:hypothetical protein
MNYFKHFGFLVVLKPTKPNFLLTKLYYNIFMHVMLNSDIPKRTNIFCKKEY